MKTSVSSRLRFAVADGLASAFDRANQVLVYWLPREARCAFLATPRRQRMAKPLADDALLVGCYRRGTRSAFVLADLEATQFAAAAALGVSA